jgi:peroxiredoxin
MATTATVTPLGTPAPDFTLPTVDGRRASLADFADAKALLVVFMCNHCPFVQHIERELAAFAAAHASQGLATVGISSNDVTSHPDDAPEQLAAQAKRADFAFPYLFDESQDVATAYGAVCTPDFFLYDQARRLAYRGEFDGARPSNDVPVTGDAMRAAVAQVLAGEAVPEPHRPSIGCSIKWRPGKG